MKRLLSTFIFSFIILRCISQTGGGYVYQFLNIPASARVAAMGGTYISAKDNDLSVAMQAPSLLNPSMSKSISLSAVSYPDGVKFGDAAYAVDYGKPGTFMAAMHFTNYGDFQETDEFGNIQGTFHAADYALYLGWAYQMNSLFSVGASLKTIYSDYYISNAFGIATDFSATFTDTVKLWTVTLEGKNVGVQLKNYESGNNEPLPAEILAGASKRLIHTPLRFNLTYRHLEKFDLSYDDPLNVGDIDPLTGESTQKKITFGNKLSSHFILGAEILFSKNFNLRAAYNFQRRRELALDTRPGLIGFSFGLDLKISKFILGWGLGTYSFAGVANHFSISTNINEFSKK